MDGAIMRPIPFIQVHVIVSDVFISYSRRDIDFVRHLFDQLPVIVSLGPTGRIFHPPLIG